MLVVTLPVVPTWLSRSRIGIAIFTAALVVGLPIASTISLWKMTAPLRLSHDPLWRVVWTAHRTDVFVFLAAAAASTFTAVHDLRMYLRFGRVPRVLTITKQQVVLTWLGWRGLRRREWATSRVVSITWLPVRDAFAPRKLTVRVTLRFNVGWPLQLMLATRDHASIERARVGLTRLLPPSVVRRGVDPTP